MGWTSTHLPHRTKILDYLTAPSFWGPKYTVLKATLVKRNTAYMAIRYKHEDKDFVFAAIYLVRYAPKSYHNLIYKEMDETVGPGYCECPESVLDLLTPTDNKYALEWRKACREYHAKRKEFNKRWKEVKEGWIISYCHNKKNYLPVFEDCAICRLKNKKRRHVKGISGFTYKSKRRILQRAQLFPDEKAFITHMISCNDIKLSELSMENDKATHRIRVGDKAVYYPLYFDGDYGIVCVASLDGGDPALCDVGCVPWNQFIWGYVSIEELPTPTSISRLCELSCPKELPEEMTVTNN